MLFFMLLLLLLLLGLELSHLVFQPDNHEHKFGVASGHIARRPRAAGPVASGQLLCSC